jgi:hypothetical protein
MGEFYLFFHLYYTTFMYICNNNYYKSRNTLICFLCSSCMQHKNKTVYVTGEHVIYVS